MVALAKPSIRMYQTRRIPLGLSMFCNVITEWAFLSISGVSTSYDLSEMISCIDSICLSNLVSSRFGIIGSTYCGNVDTWILWAEWKIGQAGIRYIDDKISLQLNRYLRLSTQSLILLDSAPSMFSISSFDWVSLSPIPRTCFSRHRIQSNAALAKTNVLSVERKTLKTSNKGADSTESELPTDATRRAPKSGRQPERISVRFVSTNSQMQLTIWEKK